MSPSSFIHNLMWMFSASDQFSVIKWKNSLSPYYKAKIVVIVIKLLFFKENENKFIFVIPTVTRYCMIYFGHFPKIGF